MEDALNHKKLQDKKSINVEVTQGYSSKSEEDDQIQYHGSPLSEMALRRQRKLVFLEICLCEYIVRSHFHYNVKTFPPQSLLTVAIKLGDMLEIESFFPDMDLMDEMLIKFTKGVVPVKNRRIPSSLDLRDIVAYCGNHGQRPVLEKEEALEASESPNPKNKDSRDQGSDDGAVIEKLIVINDDKPLVPTNDDEVSECELGPSTSNASKRRSIKDGNIDPEMAPVVCNKDALRRLKPLKKFALIEENHPAFGLLTQLDKIFANAAEKDTKI
ncbi:uncharacterized protein Dana_GF24071 [Drosophila ananassae]|uniref:Uncharacterized protein n=1 Tax=Drosophila ananassae TaxID=7217 RepID=B3MAE4_DROAN|nr:uncharacterized protein LOC6506706 [Drosophila ananassae]EDV40195.2 uncharacterized protein Dana_GF24071 [Drosophila ananassae]